jgi:diguanylate cyclase (GGDEF)-like protein
MTTRRSIVLALVLPALVATGVALAWSAWSQQRAHERIATLATQAGREKALQEATGSLGGEVGYIIAVRKVSPDDIPGALAPYVASGRALASARGGPEAALPLLDQADSAGPEALGRLQESGVQTSAALERVMQPMEGGARKFVASSTGPDGIPWKDYATGITELQGHFIAAAPASRAAIEELVGASKEGPTWKKPEFLALAAGLLAFVLAAAAGLGWRVGQRVSRAEAARDDERQRAEALERRNSRLMAMVDANRRVQSGSDLRTVSMSVAEEARELLGTPCGALYLLDDQGTAHPVACSGDPRPVPIFPNQGVVGRAMDSGTPARAVVATDPAFADTPGVLSIVVAPLVAAGKVTGAIVVATPDGSLAEEDDESTLRLVALVAAAAVEAARTHDTTAELVHTDALTGLANRRRMDGDLAGLHTEQHTNGVAFLMIDVDKFKDYNDAHGHPAGDALLRQVATSIRECVREGDVVYRFGGEEFAVLLRGASDLEAQAVASRIRAAVADHTFPGAESQPGGKVTVSVGVSRHLDGSDPAALLSQADDALFSAKRGGRNRVVFAA